MASGLVLVASKAEDSHQAAHFYVPDSTSIRLTIRALKNANVGKEKRGRGRSNQRTLREIDTGKDIANGD